MTEDAAHQMKSKEREWMKIDVMDLTRKRVRRQVTVRDESSASHAFICLGARTPRASCTVICLCGARSLRASCAVLVFPELLVCDQTTG